MIQYKGESCEAVESLKTEREKERAVDREKERCGGRERERNQCEWEWLFSALRFVHSGNRVFSGVRQN